MNLKSFLDEKYLEFNSPAFIKDDPVSIPHLFSTRQDIEISGLFAATFAWGLRKTIINKCKSMLELMDWAPHDFVINYSDKDLRKFTTFRHRTFNSVDLFYFMEWLQWYYRQHVTLEDAFVRNLRSEDNDVRNALTGFHDLFFSLPEYPERTKKHVATPERNSSCKRINMFLRWMVRDDERGVDFGIWKRIKTSQLVIPMDIHVQRVARKLGITESKQVNWQSAVELTSKLKKLDPNDPVKYDFALFGLGVFEKIGQ